MTNGQTQNELVETKLNLLSRNPDAYVYLFKTSHRNEFIPKLRLLNDLQIIYLEEWGRGISTEQLKTFKNKLEEIGRFGDSFINEAVMNFRLNISAFDKVINNNNITSKMSIIRDNPKTDVMIYSSNEIKKLFEILIFIDLFDKDVKTSGEFELVETKWINKISEFDNKLDELIEFILNDVANSIKNNQLNPRAIFSKYIKKLLDDKLKS